MQKPDDAPTEGKGEWRAAGEKERLQEELVADRLHRSAVSNTESLSNKVGNATDGTVGQQTLLNEATTVASHGVEYVKGVVGLGGNKPAANASDAAHNTQAGQTLGGLINESRDLAAHALHAAQESVAVLSLAPFLD